MTVIKDPDFSGWLTKRSAWLKEWRNQLYFSKEPGKAPHGKVDLQECLTVKSAEEKTNKRHCFEVATPESTFYMYAETEKE
eukprot:GSMAST32.ASY1.ANO1.1285.1 assembled CDS